ncbi:hypothetical protein EC968_003800 [Mortierella alpina]|nr:hypothetical protein EC968_003800 [Mortierella alpina]
MSTPIAPPAAFGLVSGTAYGSLSPEALDEMLDHLELGSLEQENFRLERAIHQLVQSNKEIAEFMEQERQEQLHEQEQESERESEDNKSQSLGFAPDPEFVQAIEENKGVIAKYERVCAQLKKAISKKRGEERTDEQLEEDVVEESTVTQSGDQDVREEDTIHTYYPNILQRRVSSRMIDDKHPPAAIEQAGFFSYMTFHWIQPMILHGRKHTIVADELQRLSANDKVERLAELMHKTWIQEVESKKQAGGQKRPNMYKVLWRCFGLYACVPFISGLLESTCKISEAVLLGYVIRFFSSPDMTVRQGMGYAMALFLVTLFHGTVHHHNFFHVLRLGTWTRQSLISLMYRKCLTISTSSSISNGTLINLISNDLQPFEKLAPFGLYALLGPLEMVVLMYFLWKELGVASLAGLLVLSLLMPIQAYFSRHFATIRTKTVQARDERIRTLSDVFSGIELVKLCAWEVPLQEKVMMLRSIELGYIWKANLMRAINMSIYFFFQPLVMLFAFVTYWLQGKTLTPDKVFVSLTLFSTLRLSMTSYFPQALEAMAEVRVSVRRITDFLLLPELRSIDHNGHDEEREVVAAGGDDNSDLDSILKREDDTLVEMRDASFSWTVSTESKNEILELSAKEQKEAQEMVKQDRGDEPIPLSSPKKTILSRITMTLHRDELLAIVGPVGSGKSSFCLALLQEMSLVSGSMILGHGQPSEDSQGLRRRHRPISMSYSAQSPWIFAGSIRSNILFGSKFDQERYDRVIRACELTRDLTLFPQGDATLIGEKGVILSGGQRARVSLARAAYRDSDVYILDDPLSAVDPKVGRALFDNCINGLLKNKARVLVTHQLQYIKDCENVIVIEQGEITHKGSVEQVMKEEVELKKTVVEGDTVKSIKSRAKFVDVLREFAAKTPDAPLEDEALLSDAEGLVSPDKAKDIHGQVKDTKATQAGKDDDDNDDDDAIMEKNLTTEEVCEGDTSFRAYVEFFRLGSSWSKLILTAICLGAAQGIFVAGDFFLSRWSSQSATEQTKSYYPMAFGLYCLGIMIMTVIRSYLFFDCVNSSARNMFRDMLDALMRTSLNFFHANPSGRIMNRFSKDMALVDELLPYVFYDTITIAIMLLGSVVTVCVVNPWIIISIPFILSAFAGLRYLYMNSSRQVKRIDSQSRSPIYSHLTETLDGLVSVRAFCRTGQFLDEHIKTQEDNGRAFFTYLAMARWLGYLLDVVSAFFLGITAIACVAARDTQQAAKAGLALSSVIGLCGQLQWAVRMSVEAAILMVSVERMVEYSHVQPEESDRRRFNPDGSSVVPNGWPMEAKVTFTDMSLTYPRGDGPVLKNITLDFKAGEKIGIVGRTGAGKSSLIGALFRLVETDTGTPPHRGGISIDGIDISQIGMHDLREKMAIIPQEPFLFRGTLRFNLDPTSQHQDADIWAALEAAELKRMVEGLEGGLDAVVDDNGKNFSIGERQLLSLARAVLRRSKIVVMDEATANVDLQSDRMIQKAIHSQFRGATVFTIAHRLNTVIGDYDRILVLDQGQVMEIGEPWELLNEDFAVGNGWLRGMVAGTGPENETKLRLAAKELWESRHSAQY